MASILSTATATLDHVWHHPANRDHRLRAVARLAGWQVWERVTRRPVTVSMPGGLRLRVHPHSTSASAVIYCRLPEWTDMRFLLDVLRPGDVFVDVGANVGVYSLLAASIPDTRVHAFEPSTDTYARLVENVDLNGLGDRLVCRRSAVGAHAGTVEFLVGHDTINRIVDDPTGLQVERVPLLTLDETIEAPDAERVALMKIDVEGTEPDVLRGATSLLERAPSLIVEANVPADIQAILAPLGYSRVRYEPDTRRLVPTDWGDGTGNNMLVVRDVPAAQARIDERKG